ncbi:hypothetical protein DOTSEDRAFT_66263 [Dothistroma septosporum NZE10]|uniref:Phosphoribosylglycinamide formyltransferase n=1 Tax=Dothistroma septosporum (strain NZE10 / CBS 128990) TaxID=675120 RepID=M2YJZ8_DOTSN|nr:hypothetical protein DOTSEDRAFT_66263 [Dothistroma septosporum NZE10]
MTDPAPPARVTVLISGSGSNLQALIDAANTAHLPNVQFVRVISDRKNAYGLERAKNAEIPTTYHAFPPYKKIRQDNADDPQNSPARHAYDADLASLVLADKPDIVVCAGFMRIMTTSILDKLAEANVPIINLHPAMPGDLVGANCIERAWEEFQEGKRTSTGIMIHYVIAEVDKGAPVESEKVEIKGCETLEQLQQRIHQAEHVLIVKGTKKAIETRRTEKGA